jgi:hypothetical protein
MTHFGIAKLNAELHLKPSEDGPGWTAYYADGTTIAADEDFLRQHFYSLLGE